MSQWYSIHLFLKIANNKKLAANQKPRKEKRYDYQTTETLKYLEICKYGITRDVERRSSDSQIHNCIYANSIPAAAALFAYPSSGCLPFYRTPQWVGWVTLTIVSMNTADCAAIRDKSVGNFLDIESQTEFRTAMILSPTLKRPSVWAWPNSCICDTNIPGSPGI